LEDVELAAVVVAHDSAVWLEGTLTALERELGPWPGAPRVLVDAASSDDTAGRARARGWRVIELDPLGATGAGAAREAARQGVVARNLLMVDADVVVEEGFVARALARLREDVGLAGVGGALRFDEGRGAPVSMGPGEESAELLAALALYRTDALERAGGFVPWLDSEEDADLGLRLRRAGGRLVRIRPGGIHRSGPRGGLSETFRRYEQGLYLGQGQVLRLRWGSDLWDATVQRQWLYLGVLVFWLGALINPWFWPLLPLLLVGAVVALALRKGSASGGFTSLVTWHVMAAGLLRGWILPPRARTYRILRDSGMDS
jgi:hypothetical protein